MDETIAHKFKTASKTYNKLWYGDSLTDTEIDEAIEVFELLLLFFGSYQRFFFVRKDINMYLSALKDYKRARTRKGSHLVLA